MLGSEWSLQLRGTGMGAWRGTAWTYFGLDLLDLCVASLVSPFAPMVDATQAVEGSRCHIPCLLWSPW